ncbi:Sprouty-related, EVH1 domain-containing protein 2 [Nymphon striatum]|nr:Sprouty-related, EVH1 domain-containing protein 2 [Nymphon striatum]
MSKSKPAVKDRRQKSVKADRDIFRRFLVASEGGRKVDLKQVLSYELTEVPYALSNADGTIRTTDKAALAHILADEYTETCLPAANGKSTCCIIDGMALVQSIGKPARCTSFGDLADTFVRSVHSSLTDSCTRVDVPFDHYYTTSVKGGTRAKRATSNINLLEGKLNTLIEKSHTLISTEKLIITAGGYDDPTVAMSSHGEISGNLKSTHEEADTRIVLHAVDAVRAGCQRLLINCRDTDVLVLLVHFCDHIAADELWMCSGTKMKPKYIPVHIVRQHLTDAICSTLPAFHAVTGCDSTSQFAGHGKKKAWQAYIKDPTVLNQFGRAEFSERLMSNAEKYVEKKNPEALPPTKHALDLHLKRAHMQASVWFSATESSPEQLSPEEFGWIKNSRGQYSPQWSTQDPVPKTCTELKTCNCRNFLIHGYPYIFRLGCADLLKFNEDADDQIKDENLKEHLKDDDDQVFMAVNLPQLESRSSSGSSSTSCGAAATGIVRSSSATPNLMMHNNVVSPVVVDPTSLSSSSPYTHPHANHHHFHRMAFFRPPRTAPSTPNGNSSTNNQTTCFKSTVGSEQKVIVKESEDLWIKQDDSTAHRSKSSLSNDKKEQILDCDKIEILSGDSYSYVQFSDKPSSRVDYSLHEYSYPVVDASCKNEKRGSISSIKKHNLDVTSPPLLPSKGRRKKDKKRDRHKNNFLLDISATNKCRNCGEYYREDENEIGTCKTPANDDNVKVCVERLTCIPAARCMLYHCVSDNEGDFNNENPCTCDPNKDSCGRRWAALSILSIFIPCLWCYLPLRCCYKIGLKNKLYGGRHAPQIKTPDESNATNIMMDSNKDCCGEERYVT